MPSIINVRNIVKTIDDATRDNTESFKQMTENYVTGSHVPKLVTILIGADKASQMYARMKAKRAKKVGIIDITIKFSANISQDFLDQELNSLSRNDDVDAILLQLPLPKALSAREAANHITPSKDVDGVNPVNIGKLAEGLDPNFDDYQIGCTPSGIAYIIKKYIDKQPTTQRLEYQHRNVTIVGKSDIVGRPLSFILMRMGFQVTVLNHWASYYHLLSRHTRNSKFIISATGHANLITGHDINPKMHSVLIDAGEDKDKNGKLCGDISKSAKANSEAYTPVPGGVGPMTIAMLMHSTLTLAEHYNYPNDI